MTDFVRTVLNHEERIRRFFQREQLRSEVIEDLTQEVLCRLFESTRRFRGDSSRGTWIYGVCRNVLYEYYRKERRVLPLFEEPTSFSDGMDRVLLSLLEENLPDRLRVIYEKKYRQGWKIREIARELSLPEGTVKYYLYEIRRLLKEQGG
ncbi:MAG: sigma-70 family RNA polymerase sigma factor [Spirochaetales bacterium]|nr:sigma-70 family RNA polymerase sigma factor [Spirochaetales bacterium]